MPKRSRATASGSTLSGGKFCFLEALTAKTKDAVALALVDIFKIIGPPGILQSDNGGEFQRLVGKQHEHFVSDVIASLKEYLPGCAEIKGRPYHSQSQGVNRRAPAPSICTARAAINRWRGAVQPDRAEHFEHRPAAWRPAGPLGRLLAAGDAHLQHEAAFGALVGRYRSLALHGAFQSPAGVALLGQTALYSV